MFTNCQTTLAVTDLKRAKEFYGKKLGLKEVGSLMPDQDAVFQCGNHQIYLYHRDTPSGSTATVCNLEVENLESAVTELRNKGVRFEEYNTPDIKTKNGIATMGDFQCAWCKDPDGNILGVANTVMAKARPAHATAQTR